MSLLNKVDFTILVVFFSSIKNKCYNHLIKTNVCTEGLEGVKIFEIEIQSNKNNKLNLIDYTIAI